MKAMQDDFDRKLQNYFTDVEHLREMFRQWLAAPTLPKRMLVIHGVGGVGKSSLLRMFRLHCKSVGVPVALASGDEQKSALDVLTRWADDLKADGVRLPEFSKTFQHYRAVQAKVENEATKLAGKLAKSAAATVVETVASTIPGIGPLLGKLGGMGAEALVDWLRGFLTKPDIDLLLDPAKKLTADFLTDLQKAANKRRIVLMLDTFEQMTALEDWAREVAQQLPANVLLVIAGRALPNWSRAWPGWIANAQVEELKPMSEDDMRELVRRYYATLRGGEPDPKQVEAIIRFARGLPLAATAVIHAWIKYPDQMGDFQAVKSLVIADVVDWLMKGIPEGLKPALEVAAIVRWFDQPILRAVMAQEDVREVYNELRRFPFVRTRAEGLALHDAVREIMDENLRVQDAERHRELHERAAAYFEKRLEKATGEEAERLGLERLYHRIRADEETGIQLFQEMAEELVRYRLLNRLRALLNDVNTYPLERENSKLWRDYYYARLVHLDGRLTDAKEIYESIRERHCTKFEKLLMTYLLVDLGDILTEFELAKGVGGLREAENALKTALSFGVLDKKVAHAWLLLAQVYLHLICWDEAFEVVSKARQYYENIQDHYMIITSLNHLLNFYALLGNWSEARKAKQEALLIAETLPSADLAKARLWRWPLEIWIGNYSVATEEYRRAINVAANIQDIELLNESLKCLGWVLGLQRRFDEAQQFFLQAEALSKERRRVWWDATAKGFFGLAWIGKDLITAGRFLSESLEQKRQLKDWLGLQELLNGLAAIAEIKHDFVGAQAKYQESLSLKWVGRRYYIAGALCGLVRVKHELGDYAAIPPLLAEAEELAQQYEYNDHLASLRLTQGHIAWEGNAPTWENGFDAALRYYQHALIYALRYNRFLLDEVLSGRPQGTPLRPIIPECLKRGEEGRRMLIALRDWWQTGLNDIGTPRPDTISPIPEGIPLLEAERIAREREPGDGSPQKTVLEQIEAALEQIG
jgi:tetratricopeptide (TPR) repeat protein